jgi:ADP-dependent NAD(P)H-hydrate dehydratase
MSIHVEPLTPALLRRHQPPSPAGNKGSRGHVVVIGGSRSTPGALLLAGVAALRVGAGVLALAAPESAAVTLAVAVPEASVTGFADDLRVHDSGGLDPVREVTGSADAVLIGPGLDDPEQTRIVMAGLVESVSGPVVLDAFALGVLPTFDGGSALLSGGGVLTPNASEAARLLEIEPDALDDDAAATAHLIAQRWNATVSYSGVIVNAAGEAYSTGAGHAGLGTSGSGDVLAGCAVGLLGRGMDPLWAAVWATYLHGAAGDRLAPRVGQLGFLARELLDQIPLVLTELQA